MKGILSRKLLFQVTAYTASTTSSTGHNCTQPTSSTGHEHGSTHNWTESTSSTGQLQVTTAPVEHSCTHNWTEQVYSQPEQLEEIKVLGKS